MVTKITHKMFSGTSKVFDGTLEAVLRGLAQTQAQTLVTAITDLTDNSTGVSDASVVAPAVFATFTAGVTDAVAKAEFETALGINRTNMSQLIASINAILVRVPVFATLVDSLGGAAPGGTLIAMDTSMVGTSSGGALVALAGANSRMTDALNRQVQLAHWVDRVCEAFNATPLVITTAARVGMVDSISGTFAALSIDTGAAASTVGTVSKAAADVALARLAANIASMAARLNAITGATVNASVVAG